MTTLWYTFTMLFTFVICYLILMLVSLRFKREAQRATMEKIYEENLDLPSSYLNDSVYTNCNAWENIIYYNEMMYCKLHLHDHVIQQVVL